MTAVDVYINGKDRTESFFLHNGLFGPATTVFHAVLGACREGSASGEWINSHAEVLMRGPVLHPMLDGLEDLKRPYQYEGDKAQLAAFREAITDHGVYAVTAIEV